MTTDGARTRDLLAEAEALLADLVLELEDLARGRRRTTTNALLLSVAIAVRLRLARRGVSEPAVLGRAAILESQWLALLPRIDCYSVPDVASDR